MAGLYVTGDIHGSVASLRMRWRSSGQDRPGPGDALLLLGDVGIRYGGQTALGLLDELAALPCDVVVMRGNHDCRYCRDLAWALRRGRAEEAAWHGAPVVRSLRRPNVLYLPDGGCAFDWEGRACLAVPGAWSIDGGLRRRLGWPYEPEEQLDEGERAQVLRWAGDLPVEHVFSHTCPESWMGDVEDLFLEGADQEATDRTTERLLDGVLAAVRPTLRGWWFGHFHDDRDVAGGLGHMLCMSIRRVI